MSQVQSPRTGPRTDGAHISHTSSSTSVPQPVWLCAVSVDCGVWPPPAPPTALAPSCVLAMQYPVYTQCRRKNQNPYPKIVTLAKSLPHVSCGQRDMVPRGPPFHSVSPTPLRWLARRSMSPSTLSGQPVHTLALLPSLTCSLQRNARGRLRAPGAWRYQTPPAEPFDSR